MDVKKKNDEACSFFYQTPFFSTSLFSNVLTRAYIFIGIMERSFYKICRTAPYDPQYYKDANKDAPKSYIFPRFKASLWCDPYKLDSY